MINKPDLIQRFFYQVKRTPNNIAIIDNDEKVTYRDLADLAKRFAKLFTTCGKNPRIVVDLPQGTSAYAAILGVVIAGGTYCPINTQLPSYRKMKIVSNFEPDLIVGLGPEDKSLSKRQYKYADIKALPNSTLEKEILPNDCIYVIYTSGSTGEPKGIAIRRSAVSHFISWAINTTGVSNSDRWGQFSNLGFDLSVMDLFTTLGGGGTLVSLNSLENRLMPAKAIRKYGLTIWHSVPSVIDLMNKAGQLSHENIATLRLMSFCGEPLLFNHVKLLLDTNQNVTIFNTYGPTETTIFCTYQPIKQENYLDVCNITASIGNPLPGWNLTLIGGETSQKGEIIIYGDHIGIGYWNDDASTSEAYREIILHGKATRAYATGDWAEFKDGHLYFRNRKDRQVKVRGYRIELSEVDFYIRQFGIPNSLSFVQNGKIYSCLETHNVPDYEKISDYLKVHLPFYSIPSKYMQIPQFPRNSNDKIDVKKIWDIIRDKL